METGKIKRREVPFSQISNSALRDEKLSLKAKGLYALIQSYITIPNFTLYKTTLMKQCKESKNTFDTAWKELKDNGYLIQYRKSNAKTKTFYYEYELLDIKTEVKIEEKATTQKAVHGEPSTRKNGSLINTDINNTDLNNNYKSYNTHGEPVTSVNNFYNTFNDLIKHINTEIDNLNLNDEFNAEKDKIAKYFSIFYSTLYKKTGLKQKVLTNRQLEDSINYCLQSITCGIFTNNEDCLFDDLLNLYMNESEFKTLNGFFSQYIFKVAPRVNKNNEDDIA